MMSSLRNGALSVLAFFAGSLIAAVYTEYQKQRKAADESMCRGRDREYEKRGRKSWRKKKNRSKSHPRRRHKVWYSDSQSEVPSSTQSSSQTQSSSPSSPVEYRRRSRKSRRFVPVHRRSLTPSPSMHSTSSTLGIGPGSPSSCPEEWLMTLYDEDVAKKNETAQENLEKFKETLKEAMEAEEQRLKARARLARRLFPPVSVRASPARVKVPDSPIQPTKLSSNKKKQLMMRQNATALQQSPTDDEKDE